jgi:hypothetical protein
MTPKEVETHVGRKVYGLGEDGQLEEFVLMSFEPPKKGGQIVQITLQPPKGDAFKVGLRDYFTNELEALVDASRVLDDFVYSAEKEIESLREDIANYKAQQQKFKRRIQKLEHLARIKKT